MNELPLLTLLTLLPMIGGVIVSGLGEQKKLARQIAFGFALAALGVTLGLWNNFNAASGELQFVERHEWIPFIGASYFVGVDGLGLLMVLLTAIVTPMAMLASWKQEDRTSLYFSLLLFLQAGLFGTFTALNFYHWFIFWELGLIPAFFLVRLWGGPQRAAASTQFFIYTMVGSVAMLLAFLAMFLAVSKPGQPCVMDFPSLAQLAGNGEITQALSTNFTWKLFGHAFTAKQICTLIFGGVLLGFAVKVPLMPFHTWLPATYSAAPSATTMLLTGVMSKMGVYGFLRILLPIFPEQMHWLRTPLLVLAVATIVFSACAAFAQKDLKRILAYSSINHLGYCLLAVFAVSTSGSALAAPATEKAAALNGALLQMFNHGLTAATLFWFVGLIEQRSGGLRGLDDFGGLRKVAPIFCGLMGIALFSSLGLPGLNGFIGEFLIFKGVFPLAMCSASIAVVGILVTAIFILTILQRVFNGPLNEKWANFADLTLGEIVQLIIPIALMFVLGLCPQLILGVVNSTVVRWVEQMKF
ncbi:MAG: NADH-quinone oxidoreductase subunit M [Verrucomicrobiota bacterium]